jgi:cytochrome c551/c552
MKLKIFLSTFAVFVCAYVFAAPPAEEGKAIFTSRCGTCHNINKVFVGPALAGVDKRHDLEWIVKFVQSSQTVIKSGDPKATALFAQFNKMPMPDHKDLSADNIKNVVEYIKVESAKVSEGDKAPFARPTTLHANYLPATGKDFFIFFCYLSAVAVLIASLLLFVKVKKYERSKVWE